MKKDIILAGVGGQGILTIAATIGTAALNTKLFLKQAEVHGMSQRGGDVQSHLRISDKPIASDLIAEGKADIIISVEPMESLRYLPFLAKDGWLVTNSNPYVNIPNYPKFDKVINEIESIQNHITIDADGIAKSLMATRSSNIIVLGAAAKFLDIPLEEFEKALKQIFGHKGEKVVNVNIEALNVGFRHTKKILRKR